MVKLKNIKKSNNTITCDFWPEDSELPGTLTVNLVTQKIESCEFPSEYEWCENHAQHSARYLLNTSDNLPKEKTLFWY